MALLSLHAAAHCAQAALEAPAERIVITVNNAGKPAATFILPAGLYTGLTPRADRIEPLGANTLRATGHVVIELGTAGTGAFTVAGDEVIVERELLDAARLQAVRDLEAMDATDQAMRSSWSKDSKPTAADWTRQQELDAANLGRLEQIVARYGWPGLRFAGMRGSNAAWLVLQHADLATQRKYEPLLRAAVARRDAQAADLATLQDRIRVRSGLPQRYGTQFKMASTAAGSVVRSALYPIEDEANLEQRRREVGLPPLATLMDAPAARD